MVIPAAKARDVLKKRLEAVFDPEVFSAIYPGAKVPKVFLGFPKNEPPFYVAVDEILDDVSTGGAASMGHARIDFTLHVWLFAKHTELKTASDTLLAYMDAVFASVMADPALNYSVDNSFPSIQGAGTAADTDKRYIAAASVDIACQVGSACPGEIREAVEDANRDM